MTLNKGRVTKEYFPDIKERLKKKVNLTPNFTAMLTKVYPHRFKITQSPECVCANGDQTVDHRSSSGPSHNRLP